jgi:hypothetical protein
MKQTLEVFLEVERGNGKLKRSQSLKIDILLSGLRSE